MDIVSLLLAPLFECHHGNVSRVFTIQRRTYQVCCDCGKEFEYSWEGMQRIPAGVAVNPLVTLVADRAYQASLM